MVRCRLVFRARRAGWKRMINVFVLQNGRLNQVNIESRSDLEQSTPVWVDLTDPNDDERDWVKSIYGVTLPGEDEVKDIEASARYYEAENGDLHLRTDFLLEEDDGPSRIVTVAFILARDMLFSVHADDLPVFRLVRMRARSRRYGGRRRGEGMVCLMRWEERWRLVIRLRRRCGRGSC